MSQELETTIVEIKENSQEIKSFLLGILKEKNPEGYYDFLKSKEAKNGEIK